MIAQEVYTDRIETTGYSAKLKDYSQFAKMRLSSLVVFSAAIGFVLAPGEYFSWFKLLILTVGGFLITGASNGFNQIIEKDLDRLMDRTQNRPLPAGRMSVREGLMVASLFAFSGILLIYIFINIQSAVLGFIALLLYTLVYTPLKRKSSFAVFVGAFPGAIPPMLGWVAATGQFDINAWILFAIQFIWQFPHFWAIAWVLDEDYKKAGFKMLPSGGGRDKRSAFQTMVYAASLIPMSFIPFYFNLTGLVSAIVISICGVLFFAQSITLFRTCEVKSARQLMFGSFIYLPIVQIALLIGKI